MSKKAKKFQMMVRGDSAPSAQAICEKDAINQLNCVELESYKQRIFVNSLERIEDETLKEKCKDLSIHYRMFKNDESCFGAKELSEYDKDKLKNCIGECVNKECLTIINEKESIPAELMQLVESEPNFPDILSNKLDVFISLLNKYVNNNKEIKNSILKLQNSSHINLTEAEHLNKQVNVLNSNSKNLQSVLINDCSENVFDEMKKYYNEKEKEYTANLSKLEHLKTQQEKYNQVDGPEYRALVKSYLQTTEMIKMKTDMLNDC
ncbi:reticulocyte-binding protein homolog 2a-like [Adelges cooleyi]|uniref:reticulocyte-binding protein homolog 2a-like n=1 Tax=Adelges cooleyi TaxID=133065 RepID=UPI002180610A|nr:reticulocyte-binding protein homolog 2a-like [Adelges cooleyi]